MISTGKLKKKLYYIKCPDCTSVLWDYLIIIILISYIIRILWFIL